MRGSSNSDKSFSVSFSELSEIDWLVSEGISVVPLWGQPKKFYPTPEKFRAIRDKLYNLRIREYRRVKDPGRNYFRLGS